MHLTTADHQRQALHQRRAAVEQLREWAEHLDPADRDLIEAVYGRGLSVTQIARAGRRKPDSIRQRLGRLIRRMNTPAFRYVLRHRGHWPAGQRRIADETILRGRSQRDTAARLGVTVHRVRKETERIRLLAAREP